MAMKKAELETSITGKIMSRLEKAPRGWFFKVHGGLLQKAGIPDIIGCLDGLFLAIEVKRPGLDATLLQRWVLEHIQKAGGLATVAHSEDEAMAFIQKIRDGLYSKG